MRDWCAQCLGPIFRVGRGQRTLTGCLEPCRSFMRALRRMEEAGPAALTPQERCTMRYLNQLLRRPLRDLWSEDPPELRARDGPNRWAPSIRC